MPLFIVLVGYIAAGKTTLAKRLEHDLDINIVSGDPLRLLIKNEIKYFSDFDLSIPTEKGKTTRDTILQYRNSISRVLLEAGQSVIYDSNALKKSDRASIFHNSTSGIENVIKIIIWVDLPESELLERLQDRPEQHWVEHYNLYKKPVFEEPSKDEADEVLVYRQDNYEHLKAKLQSLLSKF